MKKYKADVKSNSYYFLGAVLFFVVTILFSLTAVNNSWILLSLPLGLYVVYDIVDLRIDELNLDKTNKSLTVILKNSIGMRRTSDYELNQIEFTFKRQALSFRSGIKNVCTIYSCDKKVIRLVSGFENWSDNQIKSFVEGLIDLKVNRKFSSHSLEDVKM